MKKLLTLVLALTMVFALAAPALAISGVTPGDEDDSTTTSPINMNMALVEKSSSAFNGFTLNPLPADKTFVKNELVMCAVNIVIPKESKFNADLDQDGPMTGSLTVTTDNMKINGFTPYDDGNEIKASDNGVANPKYPVLDTKEDKKYVVSFNVKDYADSTVTFLFEGYVSTVENGTIKATFTCGQAADNKMVDGEKYTVYENKKDGKPLYEMIKNDNAKDNYTILNCKTNFKLEFHINGNKECDKIYLYDLSSEKVEDHKSYEVSRSATNSGLYFKGIGTYDITSDKDAYAYSRLMSEYNKIMDYMGFKIDAGGQLFDKLFTNKLNTTRLNSSLNVPVYGAVTPTTPPGGTGTTTPPPKTGDTATTMGFVMIAAAIIAAAAVAYRKVRN